MIVTIAAIGKMKSSSPESAILREYLKRLKWKINIKECKDNAALLAACKSCDKIIALDECGNNLSSRELADKFSAWQNQSTSHIGIIIGGADGLSDNLRKKTDLLLAFGRATWPHMLIRAMLAEQIYRISTIIDEHPYHRD